MNEMTLIETLDLIRNYYKSIAFESAVITQSMHGVEWTDKERLTCMNTIKYALNSIEYYQREIERGHYKEVNPYGV